MNLQSSYRFVGGLAFRLLSSGAMLVFMAACGGGNSGADTAVAGNGGSKPNLPSKLLMIPGNSNGAVILDAVGEEFVVDATDLTIYSNSTKLPTGIRLQLIDGSYVSSVYPSTARIGRVEFDAGKAYLSCDSFNGAYFSAGLMKIISASLQQKSTKDLNIVDYGSAVGDPNTKFVCLKDNSHYLWPSLDGILDATVWSKNNSYRIQYVTGALVDNGLRELPHFRVQGTTLYYDKTKIGVVVTSGPAGLQNRFLCDVVNGFNAPADIGDGNLPLGQVCPGIASTGDTFDPFTLSWKTLPVSLWTKSYELTDGHIKATLTNNSDNLARCTLKASYTFTDTTLRAGSGFQRDESSTYIVPAKAQQEYWFGPNVVVNSGKVDGYCYY